jgi:hypothetical protein
LPRPHAAPCPRLYVTDYPTGRRLTADPERNDPVARIAPDGSPSYSRRLECSFCGSSLGGRREETRTWRRLVHVYLCGCKHRRRIPAQRLNEAA